jgi:hypothetical protein
MNDDKKTTAGAPGFRPVRPTRQELYLLLRIRDRALELAEELGAPHYREDHFGLYLDLLKTHQLCGLRLWDLLEADMANFGHDVFGIYRHFDRTAGMLVDGFYPRYGCQQGDTLAVVVYGFRAGKTNVVQDGLPNAEAPAVMPATKKEL